MMALSPKIFVRNDVDTFALFAYVTDTPHTIFVQ